MPGIFALPCFCSGRRPILLARLSTFFVSGRSLNSLGTQWSTLRICFSGFLVVPSLILHLETLAGWEYLDLRKSKPIALTLPAYLHHLWETFNVIYKWGIAFLCNIQPAFSNNFSTCRNNIWKTLGTTNASSINFSKVVFASSHIAVIQCNNIFL